MVRWPLSPSLTPWKTHTHTHTQKGEGNKKKRQAQQRTHSKTARTTSHEIPRNKKKGQYWHSHKQEWPAFLESQKTRTRTLQRKKKDGIPRLPNRQGERKKEKKNNQAGEVDLSNRKLRPLPLSLSRISIIIQTFFFFRVFGSLLFCFFTTCLSLSLSLSCPWSSFLPSFFPSFLLTHPVCLLCERVQTLFFFFLFSFFFFFFTWKRWKKKSGLW